MNKKDLDLLTTKSESTPKINKTDSDHKMSLRKRKKKAPEEKIEKFIQLEEEKKD